jgi:hypothetical protein
MSLLKRLDEIDSKAKRCNKIFFCVSSEHALNVGITDLHPGELLTLTSALRTAVEALKKCGSPYFIDSSTHLSDLEERQTISRKALADINTLYAKGGKE